MTDAELREACRRLPWERRLARKGISNTLCLLCGLAAAVVTYWVFGGVLGILYAVGAALGGIIVGTLVLNWAINLRSRRFQAELLARYAPWEPNASAHNPANVFGGDTPPDFVLVFKGHALPHGGIHSIRVLLWETVPPQGQLDIRTRSHRDIRQNKPFTSETGMVELTADESASLLTFLPELLDTKPKKITSTVIDGFPCTMMVLRHHPLATVTFQCNLVGIPDSFASHPAPLLMKRMLALSKQVITQPMVVGWCGPHGSIGIDEI